jgi:hypothetical protein
MKCALEDSSLGETQTDGADTRTNIGDAGCFAVWAGQVWGRVGAAVAIKRAKVGSADRTYVSCIIIRPIGTTEQLSN